MNLRLTLLSLICILCFCASSNAQLPLVYDEENTGADCNPPPLPDPANLTNYPLLPDPFAWSDGSGRSTDFEDWECRRNEIKAEVEHYELGLKPDRPEDISASYEDGTLTVDVTVNGETLTLTSSFSIPEGDGPFPVVIGMDNPTGSLSPDFFEGMLQIPFTLDQIVTNNNNYNEDDPYYRLYPELSGDVIGHYSAWAWGFSRLLDGLELLQDELKVDMSHIAATGCSYAGKMALFSGAFDERVALTIVQESGGGGINSWRVSYDMVVVQGQAEVERISNTNYSWFKDDLRTHFDGANVGKLPYDHHEIMAMIAPRALLVLGNTTQVWLADESGYIASRAAEKVYDEFGIPERFGFSFTSDHPHCALPDESDSEVQAFIDRFLLGDETANTTIRKHPFDNIDYNRWIEGWEPPNPDAPVITLDSPTGEEEYVTPVTLTFEASVTDINDNVTKVEFFSGQDLLGEDTEAPYSFTWEDMETGNYFISAEATDAEGLTDISNIVNIVVKNPDIEVHSLGAVPTIDGAIDELWNNENVPVFEAKTVLVGDEYDENNLSGSARVMWSNNFIYLLAEVTDDATHNDSETIWQDDNVEFYFDGDNSKTSPYDANDSQITFAWNDGTTIGTIPAGKSTDGTTYMIMDTENGYVVEARIPWGVIPATPEEDMLIGFEFMINDDDDGGDDREGKLSWNATEDQAWQDASHFGTIKLVGTGVVEGEEKLNQTISITAIPDKLTTDEPFNVAATTTSQLPLTYSVSGPATNSGATITLDGTVGTVEVTVNQAGNDLYNPADATESFDVSEPPPPQDQTISITNIPDKLTTDAPFDVIATTTSQLALTYAVTGPASISGTTITLDGTSGSVNVTVSQVGNDEFNPSEASTSFNVTEPPLGTADENIIDIYPNPAEKVLSISGHKNKFEYEIFDVAGQLQMSGKSRGEIKIETLSKGVYLLNIVDGKRRLKSKFIKE